MGYINSTLGSCGLPSNREDSAARSNGIMCGSLQSCSRDGISVSYVLRTQSSVLYGHEGREMILNLCRQRLPVLFACVVALVLISGCSLTLPGAVALDEVRARSEAKVPPTEDHLVELGARVKVLLTDGTSIKGSIVDRIPRFSRRIEMTSHHQAAVIRAS